MSLGKILLRPQNISTAATVRSDDMELSVDLIMRLSEAFLKDKLVLSILQEEFEDVLNRFLTDHNVYLQNAFDRLLGWVSPAVNAFEDLSAHLKDRPPEDASMYILERLCALLQNLSKDKIESALNGLFDVLENELQEVVRNAAGRLIHPTLDRLVQHLQEDFLSGSTDCDAINRYMLGKDIELFRSKIAVNIQVPDFNRDIILKPLLDMLDKIDFEGNVSKISDLLGNSKEVIEKVSALLSLQLSASLDISASSAGVSDGGPFFSPRMSSAPLMAGDNGNGDDEGPSERYLWYASWLTGDDYWMKGNKIYIDELNVLFSADASIQNDLNNYRVPDSLRQHFTVKEIELSNNLDVNIETEGRIWLIEDKDEDEIYTVFLEEGKLSVYRGRVHENDEWWRIESLRDYTFDPVDAETADKIAYHTSWARDLLTVVPHAISVEQGDWISNLFNLLSNTTYAGLKLAGPQGFGWSTKDFPLSSFWLKWLLPSGLTFAASFEDLWTNVSGGYWFFALFLTDEAEFLLYAYWTKMLRDAVLSTITLVNYEGPKDPPFFSDVDNRPLNRKEIDGVAYLFSELGVWLLALGFPKEDFGWPNNNNLDKLGGLFGHMFGLGALVGTLSGIVGTTVAECISWCEDWPALGWMILKSVAFTWIKYGPCLYLAHDGKTEDGRYSGNGNPFIGYQDRTTSPYLLPYEQGDVYHCVQGHLGFWSHTPHSNESQIYAVDFGMGSGDNVLAMRPGIVWTFIDGNPDGGSNLNNIRILHNLPADTNHDLVRSAVNPVRTFAEYLHGIQASVRTAFNPRLSAINPNFVIQMMQINTIVANAAATAAFLAANIDLVTLAPLPDPRNPPNTMGQRQIAVAADTSTTPAAPVQPVAVLQGQVIMQADHTGRSAYNHLHIHIKPNVGPAGNVPIRGQFTIPFVFQDIDGDGVPKSMDFYESNNTLVP